MSVFAPQAIYPDTVSWTLSGDGKKVLVKVALPVDFEEDKDVEVWDWSEEAAPSAVEPVEVLVQDTQTLDLKEKEEQAAPSAAPGRSKRRRGGRTRGGDANAGPQRQPSRVDVRLAPTAAPFQPRQSPTAPRIERDAPAREPKPAVKVAPVASSTSTKPSRVRIAQRPAETTAPVSPPAPARPASTPAHKQPRIFKLRHLPPLALDIRLSETYPNTAGPEEVTLLDEFGWLGEERRRIAEKTLAAGAWRHLS